MRKTIQLAVETPCHEKWGNFKVTANGGYCGTCFKNVIDFSAMTDNEIRNFFSSPQSNVCGRFRTDQLKTYAELSPVRPGLNLLRASIATLALLFIFRPSSAQTLSIKPTENIVAHPDESQNIRWTQHGTIEGIITSAEDGQPLPGVNVILKNSEGGTVSDGDGHFSITADFHAGDVLVFTFIGLETKEWKVREEDINNRVALGMNVDVKMEICTMVMGAVAVSEVYKEPSRFAKAWGRIKSVF